MLTSLNAPLLRRAPPRNAFQNLKARMMLEGDKTNKKPEKLSDLAAEVADWRKVLETAGVGANLSSFKRWYWDHPFFGDGASSTIESAPPVERLYALYGTNLPTECAYLYKKDVKQPTLDGKLEDTPFAGYSVSKGIIYEVP
jgi:hypothetical protein